MTKLVGYKKIIITYQVITGNYSYLKRKDKNKMIKKYKVITGN